MTNKYPVTSVDQMQGMLLAHSDLRICLFARGFLVTNSERDFTDEYPFYGLWKKQVLDEMRIYTHPFEHFYSYSAGDQIFILFGHAYNPFPMVHDENVLLESCAGSGNNKDDVFQIVSQWTGAFVFCIYQNGELTVLTDASSMKMCSYAIRDGKYYFSSHTQLLADILECQMTSYAKKLRQTKMYNIGLRWMPGDMTAYAEISRLGVNLYALWDTKTITIKRFYPTAPHKELLTEEEQSNAVDEFYRIISANLKLCSEKWERPAISLTGGMDSGATLACTKGTTERFKLFSFDCKEVERIDSEAAKAICKIIQQPHTQYHIPESSEEIPQYEEIKKIINHNTAYVKNLAEEELRKIAYLRNITDYDVEIKSDVAEIGRVFYERKYGMPMPQTFNERHMSAIQTRFFCMPRLLHKTDDAYFAFLNKAKIAKPLFNYEHSDLLYWEFRIGVSAATTTLSFGILPAVLTFPYNNRVLLELFLSFPHDMRKADYPQREVRQRYMPEIALKEMEVEDGYFQKWRIGLERAFFQYRTSFYHPKKVRK